jgi:hypothetical protein
LLNAFNGYSLIHKCRHVHCTAEHNNSEFGNYLFCLVLNAAGRLMSAERPKSWVLRRRMELGSVLRPWATDRIPNLPVS